MPGADLRSLRDVWYHTLEKFPDKTAVIADGAAHSYAECDLLSDRLRRALAERFGFQKGDRVAVAAPNEMEYCITYWAVMKAGGVLVPINTRLGPEELTPLLAQAEPQILFVHKSSWPTIRKALASAKMSPHLVGIGFSEAGMVPYDDLVAEGDRCAAMPELGEHDLAIILFTSGTTGLPKGAMMRHGDLLFNNRLAIYAHGLRHEDVHLLVVPMFHATAAYSLLPTSALLGSTLAMAPKTDTGFLVELIEKHRVTTFFGVPAMFRFLELFPDLAKHDLRSLRLLAYAGAPMPPATVRRLRELLPRVELHNFFGLTETISMTHVLADCDALARAESVGKLLPHVSQRILGEDGREMPRGQVGELSFHRSNVICGYWKQPDLLDQAMRGPFDHALRQAQGRPEEARTGGDWFNTGDLAEVDAEGYLYLKGRSKDMIIVGGENVYAVEVEHCIAGCEKVLEAAVIGVPATGARMHLGELVKAVVVPRPGVQLTEAEIKRHCIERLASYKVPQIVEFRSELPRNTGGKVLKRLLKQASGGGA